MITRALTIWLLLAPALFADTGSVDTNVDEWPETPLVYTVVAFPENYKTDPLSQDIIKGFATDPTLKELRSRSKVWTYDTSHPDWRHRFASRVKEVPTVIVMAGDKVIYKRSQANSEQLSEEIREGRLFDRFPTCPGPNCPQPDDGPYRPDRPNRPSTPNQPPIPDRPLIPDTPPTDPVPETPAVPDETLVKIQADIKVLIERIEKLEQAPKPKDGADGKDGANGKDGKDGEVDYSRVEKWIRDNAKDFCPKQPTIDELVAALPPITFERLNEKGEVIDSVPVYLGKKARFPTLTVNYLNDSGSVLDTEYVPVPGGVLNLHIDVLPPKTPNN